MERIDIILILFCLLFLGTCGILSFHGLEYEKQVEERFQVFEKHCWERGGLVKVQDASGYTKKVCDLPDGPTELFVPGPYIKNLKGNE